MGESHLDPAIDAEELASLIVELLQILSIPVEVGGDEQVRAEVDPMTVRQNGERYVLN